ncbi:MAG: hypothetical protein HGA42_13345 [Nostocales cyanobacterium W4_Combined_metabat2_030]|nr:hypothetical protein [Nostocales cyanobacterium W4_Combined_metabat2_030]
MTVDEFNHHWAAKGYKLESRYAKGQSYRYLRLLNIYQDKEMKQFLFPEHLKNDVPQEVFDYLDDLSKQ